MQNVSYPVTSFEWQPDTPPDTGVLLVHGLLDTTFIMRDVGKIFLDQGCLVNVILLPGHGSHPENLHVTQSAEWSAAVLQGVKALKTRVRKILLVGYSLGAALSVLHALEDPAISGIIALAPSFRLAPPIPWMIRLRARLAKTSSSPVWLKWAHESDTVKYSSMCLNAAQQVLQITQILQEKLKTSRLACPLLLATSLEDSIICSKTAIEIFLAHKNPASRAIIWSGNAAAVAKKQASPGMVFRNSYLPKMGILNFSHIAIPVAPDNAHYGMQGDYPFASHINPAVFQYGEVGNFRACWKNIKFRLGLSKLKYRRLTFNPDFFFLQDAIIRFLSHI